MRYAGFSAPTKLPVIVFLCFTTLLCKNQIMKGWIGLIKTVGYVDRCPLTMPNHHHHHHHHRQLQQPIARAVAKYVSAHMEVVP